MKNLLQKRAEIPIRRHHAVTLDHVVEDNALAQGANDHGNESDGSIADSEDGDGLDHQLSSDEISLDDFEPYTHEDLRRLMHEDGVVVIAPKVAEDGRVSFWTTEVPNTVAEVDDLWDKVTLVTDHAVWDDGREGIFVGKDVMERLMNGAEQAGNNADLVGMEAQSSHEHVMTGEANQLSLNSVDYGSIDAGGAFGTNLQSGHSSEPMNMGPHRGSVTVNWPNESMGGSPLYNGMANEGVSDDLSRPNGSNAELFTEQAPFRSSAGTDVLELMIGPDSRLRALSLPKFFQEDLPRLPSAAQMLAQLPTQDGTCLDASVNAQGTIVLSWRPRPESEAEVMDMLQKAYYLAENSRLDPATGLYRVNPGVFLPLAYTLSGQSWASSPPANLAAQAIERAQQSVFTTSISQEGAPDLVIVDGSFVNLYVDDGGTVHAVWNALPGTQEEMASAWKHLRNIAANSRFDAYSGTYQFWAQSEPIWEFQGLEEDSPHELSTPSESGSVDAGTSYALTHEASEETELEARTNLSQEFEELGNGIGSEVEMGTESGMDWLTTIARVFEHMPP